jgi:hypothetical protein|tara:strand:- start:163 stop:426 length:264 start_codon:yes stop_codon:yes gene_type:complete
MADKVKQPPHYFRFKIEPITFIMQNEIPYAEGNAIKYLCRWRWKHKTKEAQIEDLKKAKQYIDLILEHEDNKSDDKIKLKLGKEGKL